MKKVLSAILLALVVITVGSFSAAAKDDANLATAVFTVSPKMTCQNCEKKVKSNLRFEKGVKDISTDLKAGTVTIRYSAKDTNEANLIKAFKKIGYTATPAAAQQCGEGSATCSDCASGKHDGKAACAHSQGKTCKECPRNNTPDCCKNKKK